MIIIAVVFLISFSASLQVYRNKIQFYMFYLISCHLSKLTYSNRLLAESPDFLCMISCHLQIEIVLVVSFEFGTFFSLSFFYLIGLWRTSSIILSGSGKGIYPCLFPDIEEKTYSILPLLWSCRCSLLGRENFLLFLLIFLLFLLCSVFLSWKGKALWKNVFAFCMLSFFCL